jgi:nickel/cobalt exporter
MTDATLAPLLAAAATIGTVHTLAGPDHYVPFIAMSRAGRWSTFKTLMVTILCGAGHVLGSILLGALGIALGWAIEPLETVEAGRGSLAGWLLVGFGVAYFAWALRRRWKDMGHALDPVRQEPGDPPSRQRESRSLTPWVLFTIFVLGPCEPLIPLLMFPAARHSVAGIIAVALVFAVCTIATMTLVVLAVHRGLAWVNPPWLTRNAHVLAGLAICVCGLAVQFGL